MKLLATLLLALTLVSCVGHRVPSPKSDVKYTHQVGWWPNDEHVKVDDFKVTVVDSQLNLFNDTSLVRMEVNGTTQGQGGWRPVVEKVHKAEKKIKHGSIDSPPIAEITITPIFKGKRDKGYTGEIMPFKITQEMHLSSMSWGLNRYIFKCGEKSAEITLHQSK